MGFVLFQGVTSPFQEPLLSHKTVTYVPGLYHALCSVVRLLDTSYIKPARSSVVRMGTGATRLRSKEETIRVALYLTRRHS